MLELQRVYASDYLTVDIQQEKEYIQVTWLQQHSSAIFRQEIERVANYAIANQITKALFDVRKRPHLDVADRSWLMREIMQKFIGRTLRFAYLVSPITLETLDIFGIQAKISQHPQLKNSMFLDVFLNKVEARQWLFSPTNS